MKFYALRDKKTGMFKQRGKSFPQSKTPDCYTSKNKAISVMNKLNEEIHYPYPSGTPKEKRKPVKCYEYELYEIEVP